MFSRKGFIRTIASVLIILMCMVMVPLTAGDKVSAAGPDTSNYSILNPHRSSGVPMGDGKVFDYTFKIYPKCSMKYKITVKDDYYFGAQEINTALYDGELKLITSTKSGELNADLEANNNGYYVVITGKGGYSVDLEYDYNVNVKVKGSSVDSTYTGAMYSSTRSFDYIGYDVPVGEDVTLGLDLSRLPSGMTLNYEWFKVGSEDDTSIGKKGQPLTVKNDAGTKIVYKCSIKSSDGKFTDYLYTSINTVYSLTYENGQHAVSMVRAYKPGEVREVYLPKVIYGSDTYNSESYYLYDENDFNSESGENFLYRSEPVDSIPESWNGTLFFLSYSRDNSNVVSLMCYFVFADGYGEKVSAGNTYHIDKSKQTDRYSQIIYSLTPEKDGTYRFTTSNVCDDFPSMFLFDKDRNLVAPDPNSELQSSPERAMSFDIKADLKAGETYYIAIPTSKYGSFDLNISFNEPSKQVNEKTFEDFVERLYVVALGRDSEPDGKAHWCKVVGNGSYSGADCARFFLTSPEFNGRNLNDEEYLKVLYKTFFDRDAAEDPEGFNFWLGKIGEWGRARVLEGFIDSTEWCNICADYGVRSGAMTAKANKASKNATAFATRLYTECLGREPEESGLNYWSLSLTNQERTGTQAAKEFFYSPEFKDKNLGDEEYVNRLYKTFMGREPETDGKAHWLNQLSSGAMNRDQVFDFFSTCEEFTGICNSYAIAR